MRSSKRKGGGFYRSDDGGETWDLVNGSHSLLQRAWYYMHVVADPQDPNTVYVADVEFFKSTDGGRNFNRVKVPHGDNHGLWIDPKNTKRMIASNDGGATVTLDGGKSGPPEDNQPTAQFYHVITDNRLPTTSMGRSRIIPPSLSPAAATTAPSAATIGTQSAAAKRAISRPTRPTRTSSMPATIRATSRVSITAPTRSRTCRVAELNRCTGAAPLDTVFSGPRPSYFLRTIPRRFITRGEAFSKPPTRE